VKKHPGERYTRFTTFSPIVAAEGIPVVESRHLTEPVLSDARDQGRALHGGDKDCRACVKHIVSLGRKMGLRVRPGGSSMQRIAEALTYGANSTGGTFCGQDGQMSGRFIRRVLEANRAISSGQASISLRETTGCSKFVLGLV